MGDPRRTRSKYQGPRHPWNKERIEREKVLVRDYGLVNKKELWKVESKLKKYKDSAKRLIAQSTAQAEKELRQLFQKLQSYNIVGATPTADEVLGATTEQLLDRRLQTIVFKKGYARSPKQARQFITHRHVLVGDKKVDSPGYLVPVGAETSVDFVPASTLAKADHPERVVLEKAKPKGKSEEALAQEEAPVTKTAEKEEEKPIEKKIEEEVTEEKEVKKAVEEVEADAIAADHEQEVKEGVKK